MRKLAYHINDFDMDIKIYDDSTIDEVIEEATSRFNNNHQGGNMDIYCVKENIMFNKVIIDYMTKRILKDYCS